MRVDGPLVMLDASTGRTIRTYEQTDNCEEVLRDGDSLFVVTGDPAPPERRSELEQTVGQLSREGCEQLLMERLEEAEDVLDRELVRVAAEQVALVVAAGLAQQLGVEKGG